MMDLIDISASAIEERDRLRELLKQAAEHQRDLVRRAAELLRGVTDYQAPLLPGEVHEWVTERDKWLQDVGIVLIHLDKAVKINTEND